MNKINPYIWLIITMLIYLPTACINSIDEDGSPGKEETTAKIRVTTHSAESNTSPTLPIHIYAFDNTDKCVAMQTMNTLQEELSLQLAAGTYSVYALTGATGSTYSIPTKATAKPDAVVALLDPVNTHSELEAGNTTITLKENEEANITITVTRIVAQITAEVTGVPDDITTVAISIEPLYKLVKLNGTYGTESNERVSFQLSKASNGTWSTSQPVFVLPRAKKATVTIAFTDALETRNYIYSSDVIIEADYQIEIKANYTGDSGSGNNGSGIISTDWKGSRTITFNFGDDDTPGNVTNLPAVGSSYQGCYVLDVTDATANSGNLLLVAPKQWENLTTETVDAQIAGYTINEISGWKLPDHSQAELLYKAGTKVPGMDNIAEYLFQDGEKKKTFSLAELSFLPYASYAKTPYHARVVKVQHVIIE